MMGGWSSRYTNYSMYAPGVLLDDFYVFQSSADGGWQGCYHYYLLATDSLSSCHPLAVSRRGSAAEAAAAPRQASGAVVGDRGKESVLLAAVPVTMQSIVVGAGNGAGGLLGKLQDRDHAQLLQWRQAMEAR